MKDYSAMSNLEINKAVAESLGNHSVALPFDCLSGDSVEWEITEAHSLSREGMLMARARRIRKDFCNKPSDAWPIITKHKISLNFSPSEDWMASSGGYFKEGEWELDLVPSSYYDHTNPLRAAMIVYLMMKEKGDA
ncbi:TPA: phage protein NinX family protein [Yersinia enterocolitica]